MQHSSHCHSLAVLHPDRCSSLELLDIDIVAMEGTCGWMENGRRHDVYTRVVFLRFCGLGNTPLERVASMQAQLTSFSALPNFLHSGCWPDYPCLYSVDINKLTELPQDSMFLSAPLHALRVPSLEDLSIELPWLPQLPPAEAQCKISSLARLTKLYITTDASTTLHSMQALWEHMGALSSLQQLSICLHVDDCVPAAPSTSDTFSIPSTWTALRSLTKLSLSNAPALHSEALLPLANLQTLDIKCPAAQLPRVATCLAQLASLTALTVQGVAEQLPNGPEQAELAASHVACSSCSSTLQVLDISHPTLAAVPLQQFSTLTRLAYAGRRDSPALFPASQVKPLASMKLLQTLTLQSITLTPEFCW
jgi:hypothetical protein